MNPFQANLQSPVIVHLVRHAHIPDHRADHALTSEGRLKALNTGHELAASIRPGETIRFFASPTRRTRQTAELIRAGLLERFSAGSSAITVAPVLVDDRLQNLQFYLDGLNYDPIRPLFEVVRWRLEHLGLAEYEAWNDFHRGFWAAADQMDYWLTHPSPAVEAPESVARRVHAYLAECLARGAEQNGLCRDVCVAHSANLRAFLQLIFGQDPGEPPFCGVVTVTPETVYYQAQTAGFPPVNSA